MCRWGIALLLLIAASSQAGDVVVNGANLGKLSGMKIDFTSDKTGTVIIKTATPPVATIPIPAVPLPTTMDLADRYPSLQALYDYVRSTKYPGTVIVDGIKIRSGIKEPVYFKAQPDGSVRKVP